ALTTLRNQLTIRPDEEVATQDERLLLAKGWLEKPPGALDVFSIVVTISQPSPNILSLCLTILASLLNLLSSHFIYHPIGETILKTLLSPTHMRQLNSNLSHTSSDLIISTLKLFNAMSDFAGGTEKRSVMDGFAWGQKSLQKLLFFRRKSKGAQGMDSITQPDVRTLYVSFILSFLSNTTPTPIKLSLLEQHRDVFLLIFKGISQDPYVVARRILEVCWEGIWSDPKIKRTLKIGLFNETTLNHLLKLYDRDDPEDSTDDHVPADLVHHFMLAVTSRPGVGICFKDRGWYPRDNSSDEITVPHAALDVGGETAKELGRKIYNKILSNIVKGLKVNEDARQQELAFKILKACPELVAGYWGAVNLTLEPRLSSRWITNISVLGTIISHPIPNSSFFLPHSTHYNPSPPPLPSILANVLPSVLSKPHLTKGLQSSSNLVQHCTAIVLSKCLAKLLCVLDFFHSTADSLEEDHETGQWLKRSRDLKTEVERRVPDFMVIVAMVQQKHAKVVGEQNTTKAALLTESALRLLWFYHKLFPRLVAEVRFDVGKLLSVVDSMIDLTGSDKIDTDNPLDHGATNGLGVLRQLHVLRLLKESDQFAWSSKSSTSSHSHLHSILTFYTTTPHAAVRDATRELLSHLLSSNIIFSHDPEELDLWLHAFPFTQRGFGAAAPDGTPLTDERTGVLAFFDDCIQRCSKTPYRYIEEASTFFARAGTSSEDVTSTQDDPRNYPSALLMTILEQLRAKVVAKLLSPSDTLAIATFTRKLTCCMTSKLRDLDHAWMIASKLEEILTRPEVAPNSAVMRNAIKRECDFLSHTLQFMQNPSRHVPTTIYSPVQDFLKQVENLPIPSSKTAALCAAYELIDWMRLVHLRLHPTEIERLLEVILRFSSSATVEFLYQLDPQLGQLWSLSDKHLDILATLPYEWAHLHLTLSQLTQARIKHSLVSLFFSSTAWNGSLQRRVSIGMHRLAAKGRKEKLPSLVQTELSLFSSIMRQGRSSQKAIDLIRLQRTMFVEFDLIREICCSRDISASEQEKISELVKAGLDPQIKCDQELVVSYCKYWTAESESAPTIQTCAFASPWIPFMEPMGIIKFLDIITLAVQSGHSLTDEDQKIVAVVLDALIRTFTTSTHIPKELQLRTHSLLDLRKCLPRHATLDRLYLLLTETGVPIGWDALPLILEESNTLSNITSLAQARWEARSAHLPLGSTLIYTFLHSEIWDETVARLISGVIYRSSMARSSLRDWLSGTAPPKTPLGNVIFVLHSYLDFASLQIESDTVHLPDTWILAIVQHLLQNEDSHDVSQLCANCIRILFQLSPSRKYFCSVYLSKEFKKGRDGCLNFPCLRLLDDIHRIDAAAVSLLLNDIVDEALQWMVPQCSGDEILENDVLVFKELSRIISYADTKPHLVEPVLKASIQNCLHMPEVVEFLIPLVSSTHLKPAVVNRQLQSIVQHLQLFRIASPSLPSREPIIQLLHTLFHIHPTNTCQPSHVTPLMRLYGGSLSLSDRLLFSIFQLYELQRKESVASIFRRWSPSSSTPLPQDTIQAILCLNPARVFRICTVFPTRRRPDGKVIGDPVVGEDILYDPIFLTLLIAQLLAEHTEISATDWVQVFRSNIISVVICVLTSRIEEFRKIAVTALGGVLRRVQEADFLEKDHVLYILNILQDILPSASLMPPVPRLPTYPVVLLAHALRATFYPSSFLYPVVSRFLLQRPELDTTDVPMLYSLLYSSEDEEWLKERAWMIRFLTEAIHEGGARDWAVLRRRHTWDLVASMWQATRLEEQALRKGMLEFFANLTSNPHAINSLVLRSSLHMWIEMQLEGGMINPSEYLAWIKILENIIVTVDVIKAHKATGGEFGATFARCLRLILRTIPPTVELSSRVLLRLANQPVECPHLGDVLALATSILKNVEPYLLWTNSALRSNKYATIPPPPHRAHGLFKNSASTQKDIEDDAWYPLRAWASSIATLWRVAMAAGQPERQVDVEVWNALTCRLLLIRASPWCGSQLNAEDMALGDWVRKETVRCHLEVSNGDKAMEV
ncbi:hypothetical protein K439DRAFT_1512242, partial [Ramaria rubella]